LHSGSLAMADRIVSIHARPRARGGK
jgi:hypothetical protein